MPEDRTTGSSEETAWRAARATELRESLSAMGIRAVALSQIDNAGITRV